MERTKPGRLVALFIHGHSDCLTGSVWLCFFCQLSHCEKVSTSLHPLLTFGPPAPFFALSGTSYFVPHEENGVRHSFHFPSSYPQTYFLPTSILYDVRKSAVLVNSESCPWLFQGSQSICHAGFFFYSMNLSSAGFLERHSHLPGACRTVSGRAGDKSHGKNPTDIILGIVSILMRKTP